MQFRRRPRRSRTFDQRSGYAFASNFEERRILEWLENMIGSRLLNSKTEVVFQFARSVFGRKPLRGLVKNKHPEVVKCRQLEDTDNIETLTDDEMPAKIMKDLLKQEILMLIGKRLKKLSSCQETEIETRQYLSRRHKWVCNH